LTTKKKITKKKVTKKATVKKVTTKRKVGRPTKYEERFCEMLIEKMAEGYSKEACAGYIGISKQTLYDWAKANPKFLDAIAIGETQSRLHWEETLVEYKVHTKNGKQINGQVFNLNMKNRFGWRDKQDVTVDDPNSKQTKKTFAFSLDVKPDDGLDE